MDVDAAFAEDLLGASSYLNDLAIGPHAGTAYLIDVGGDPSDGLIVLDLATGRARRVLGGHETFRAQASHAPGCIHAAGQPLRAPGADGRLRAVEVGASGAAISPDGQTLYWNRADELFSIATDDLNRPNEDPDALNRAITRWPLRPFASDGPDQDHQGRIVLTDLANSGAQRLDPQTGTYELLATAPQISWPDGVAVAPDDSIYLTSSQFHHGPAFHPHDQRTPPFGVSRLTPPTVAAVKDAQAIAFWHVRRLCSWRRWGSERSVDQVTRTVLPITARRSIAS